MRLVTAGYISDIVKLKNSNNGNARYSFKIDGRRFYTGSDSSYTDVVKNAKQGDYIAVESPRGITVSKITLIPEHNPNLILASYSGRFTAKSLKHFLEDVRGLMIQHGVTTEIPYYEGRNNYSAVDLHSKYNPRSTCLANLECGTPRECAESVITHYYNMIKG